MPVRADKGSALVTGAGRRIGHAIALQLARRGLAVGVHCHQSVSEACDLAAAIEQRGGRAAVIEADLADATAVDGLIERTARALGVPSVLVNNASLFEHDEAATLQVALWETSLAVNLTAPVLLAARFAAALPGDDRGVIINIIDQRVVRPQPGFFSYGVSKAALWAATEMLAQSLAPRVRVNAIGPGPTVRSIHQSGSAFRAQQQALPLARGPLPDEIAAAVGFILDQPSMTGHLLLLDGGQHLAWRTADVFHDRNPVAAKEE